MKTYEEIKNTIDTFKSANETREALIKTKNQRIVVACYEEIFKALKTKERVACFNFEYNLTKTTDTKLTEARVIDTSDNKSLFQLYSKESGKEYEVVLSKIEKYHDAFVEALKNVATLTNGKVFVARCTYENLPIVIEKAHSVLNVGKTSTKTSPKSKGSTKK